MALSLDFARTLGRSILDIPLPPRCLGCAVVVNDPGSLCSACWNSCDFLAGPACGQCGRPHHLLVNDDPAMRCGACLAHPPAFDSMRAVLAYDDVARTVALQLKYGRQIAHARTIARLMLRLIPPECEPAHALLIPVPLHRWRIWRRGYNQSALIGDHLARLTGIPHDPGVLIRTKATPSLGHLNRTMRRKAISGAFAVNRSLKNKAVVLIDDVYTTGATAEGCAHALKKAGADRVDVLCWTRVIDDPNG
jgi:ComF family protein